jgi:epoxyqueuosine reductase
VDAARVIVDESRALGFHRVGITPVEPAARHHLYTQWLDAGHAGEMTYLARDADTRRDVRAIFGEARTVVAVALSYAAPDAPIPIGGGPRGQIARYARGEDYHAVLKRKLAALADKLAARLGRQVAARPCVDTAAVLERDVHERAGVGFVGKNTMLIAPGLGSWVVLGELLLDVDAAPTADEPARKRCGECRACLDACPTGAFVDAFVLDARRCISYLTIELRGAIPVDLRPLIGTRIFGCDVCQDVCPFNATRGEAGAPELAPRDGERAAPALIPLLTTGNARYRTFVRRSALRRITREQLVRNVCVALGNAGDASALPALRRALAEDKSDMVREHAAWAIARLERE